MEIATVQGEKRTLAGHHANERLRRRGLVPGVIYGHGLPPEYVAVSRHDLALALDRMQHVIRLKTDGPEQQYLVKAVQYDHLQKTPVHVDLMRVDMSERVHVKVALEFRGTPAGAHEGGTLATLMTDLEVECDLMSIPGAIRVKVDHLGLSQALHVKDIELPPGVKARHAPDDIVALVHPPRVVVEAAPAEVAATAEPEVIGKRPQEGATGEGGGE